MAILLVSAKLHQTLREIEQQYSGKIRLIYRQFPSPAHPLARPAAEASLCAREQGEDKFWKFHDLAFEKQRKLSPSILSDWAEKAGAEKSAFQACMVAGKYSKLVQSDLDYGVQLGVQATPTFFINGRQVTGDISRQAVAHIVKEELGELPMGEPDKEGKKSKGKCPFGF